MNSSIAALVVAVGLPCAAAQGAIFFTFQDPGPGREVTLQQEEDDSFSFSYSFDDTVSLFVTSDNGEIANTTFAETRLTLNMQTDTVPLVDQEGLLVTHLSGEFVFEDVSGMAPTTILTGLFDEAVATLLMGELMGQIEASGSVAGSTIVGSLQLMAGEALTSLMDPGATLGGRQTSSFALSDLLGSDEGNGLALTGSAAYTGSSEVLVPAPGGAALLGLSGLVAMRRRR